MCTRRDAYSDEAIVEIQAQDPSGNGGVLPEGPLDLPEHDLLHTRARLPVKPVLQLVRISDLADAQCQCNHQQGQYPNSLYSPHPFQLSH